MNTSKTICAVIVTYNRKADLKTCIEALLTQTRRPDKIQVMDNASTDGTSMMIEKCFSGQATISYCNLNDNLGGAGGFHHGARKAYAEGFDWVWMMDDDCVPTNDCLEKLMAGIHNKEDVYSPVVLSREDRKTVLWGIQAIVGSGNQEVGTLPFNGFLIHRDAIKSIGFPEKRFFIYGDDTEYNQRARASGRRIIMNTDSVMYHPHKNMPRGLKVYKMFLNPLWTYYKLRNAIIIYKKYGYFSRNQIIMFVSAGIFYSLTLNFRFLKLWLEAFRDGINGRLYVRKV